MDICELHDQDRGAWDDFVYGSPEAKVFHLSGWKGVMEASFGLRCRFLYVKHGDQIQGILPLVQVNSPLSGNYFTSMPGSLLAINENAAMILGNHAHQLLKDAGARYVLLRDGYHKWDLEGLVTKNEQCTFTVKLCDDPAVMWKSIDRRVRQHTKHAMDANLHVDFGLEYLDEFYPSYTQTMRQMGTPAFGMGFFRRVFDAFPSNFIVIMVRQNQEILGGIVAAIFKETLYNIWWGMLPEFYELHSCHILYWEIFKYGCERGLTQVDLGRSELNSGTYTFKNRWPAVSQPLYEQFYSNGTSNLPVIGGERSVDRNYRLFVKIWQRLPLTWTNSLGPEMRKHMPFG